MALGQRGVRGCLPLVRPGRGGTGRVGSGIKEFLDHPAESSPAGGGREDLAKLIHPSQLGSEEAVAGYAEVTEHGQDSVLAAARAMRRQPGE
jgi:hypothetical protein